MSLDFSEGLHIAQTFSVQTEINSAVLYSISYQPTTQNRDAAYEYVKTHLCAQTLDDTPCGKTLCALGYQSTMDIAPGELKKIWHVASERFIEAASGDLKAFVEGADKRSTFCSVEAPAILKNEKIKTINGIDKNVFLKDFIA
jgi:hypothetical protein